MKGRGLLEERESGDFSKDRWALAEGRGVPAIAKPTVEPLDHFEISIVVIMPGHLLEGMPLGAERKRGLSLQPPLAVPTPTGLVWLLTWLSSLCSPCPS